MEGKRESAIKGTRNSIKKSSIRISSEVRGQGKSSPRGRTELKLQKLVQLQVLRSISVSNWEPSRFWGRGIISTKVIQLVIQKIKLEEVGPGKRIIGYHNI